VNTGTGIAEVNGRSLGHKTNLNCLFRSALWYALGSANVDTYLEIQSGQKYFIKVAEGSM
jgi:hypothetical protein